MLIHLSFLFLSSSIFLINGSDSFIKLFFPFPNNQDKQLEHISYACFKSYFNTNNLHIDNLKHRIEWTINTTIAQNTNQITKDMLDLLFLPLTIDPTSPIADRDLFEFLEQIFTEKLKITDEISQQIKYWHNAFGINKFVEEKIRLHTKYKTLLTDQIPINFKTLIGNKLFYQNDTSYNNDDNGITPNLYHVYLIYKAHFANNPNSFYLDTVVDWSFFENNNTLNFNDIYTYLCNQKLMPPKESITSIHCSMSPLQTAWLKNVRIVFPKLSEIKYLDLDKKPLELDKNYDTFYYLIYDNNHNFNPLTISVTNPEETEQIIKRSVLVWYKSIKLAPLGLMFTNVQSLFFLTYTYNIEFNFIRLIACIFEIAAVIAPMVSTLIGFTTGMDIQGLKDNHTMLGFNLKYNDIVHKHDLIIIIPILLHLYVQIQRKIIFNTSLNKFLLHYTCTTLFFIPVLYAIDKFKTEYVVYQILNNIICKKL